MTPVPRDARAAPPPSFVRWWRRLSPLGRDIVLILALKVLVLFLLWYAFFSSPAAVRMTMDPRQVERNLVAPVAPTEPPRAVR